MKFKHIAKLVKDRREALNMTQAELAKKLGFKSAQYISNCERGLSSLPVDNISLLALVLKVGKDVVIKAMVLDYKEYLERKAKLE